MSDLTLENSALFTLIFNTRDLLDYSLIVATLTWRERQVSLRYIVRELVTFIKLGKTVLSICILKNILSSSVFTEFVWCIYLFVIYLHSLGYICLINGDDLSVHDRLLSDVYVCPVYDLF